jgi:hypothetical protein
VNRPTIFAVALVLGVVATGILAGSPMAQTGPRTYEACEPDQGKIDAADLPKVVDEDLCSVAGKTIVDHGAGTVVPEPGESVFAEAMSPEGNQQIVVSNPPGDRLLLREVGSEAEQQESGTFTALAVGPDPCSDSAYNSWNMRLNSYIRWYFKAGTTPSYMSKSEPLGR